MNGVIVGVAMTHTSRVPIRASGNKNLEIGYISESRILAVEVHHANPLRLASDA